MTHYFPNETRAFVAHNLADFFDRSSGSIDGVLEQINASLDNKGYGWREALDNELFRWPHELKSAEETFCSERALWFYAHTQLAGLNPQYHILEHYGGGNYHHEVVTVERDGETVLLDWHGPHKGNWEGNSFVATAKNGKQYVFAKHSKRHEIPHDNVLSRVHELRSGAYFRRALQVPQILNRQSVNWAKGRLDFTLEYQEKGDALVFAGRYRNSMFGFDTEYRARFSNSDRVQEDLSVLFPEERYILFSAATKKRNQLRKIRRKSKQTPGVDFEGMSHWFPSASGGIAALQKMDERFLDVMAAVDYVHKGENGIVYDRKELLQYVKYVASKIASNDREGITLEDALVYDVAIYNINDNNVGKLDFEGFLRRVDFLLHKRVMRERGIQQSCEEAIFNNAHPAIVMGMNGNQVASALYQLSRPISAFFRADEITSVYNRALHVVGKGIGHRSTPFTSDRQKLGETLPLLTNLCTLNKIFHGNSSGFGNGNDMFLDQITGVVNEMLGDSPFKLT